ALGPFIAASRSTSMLSQPLPQLFTEGNICGVRRPPNIEHREETNEPLYLLLRFQPSPRCSCSPNPYKPRLFSRGLGYQAPAAMPATIAATVPPHAVLSLLHSSTHQSVARSTASMQVRSLLLP